MEFQAVTGGMNLIPGVYKEYWTGSRATKEPLTQSKESLSLSDFDASKEIQSGNIVRQINSEFNLRPPFFWYDTDFKKKI